LNLHSSSLIRSTTNYLILAHGKLPLIKKQNPPSSFGRIAVGIASKKTAVPEICKLPIDGDRMEKNRLEWAKENNKDPNARRKRSDGDKRTNPEWRVPSPDENNKRIIYGKPYTWNS
jgi:hypothetical protein